MGIEPTSAAWEAAILPLNHARSGLPYQTNRNFGKCALDRIGRQFRWLVVFDRAFTMTGEVGPSSELGG
jgi:hypothetical protein